MKKDMKETTGQDGNTCTMKPHRLICIHHPGKVTGPRVAARSARAEVPTDEQKTGVRPGPEPPMKERLLVRAIPAGSEPGVQSLPGGAEGPWMFIRRGNGNRQPEIPAMPEDRQQEMPVENGHTGQEEPGGNGKDRGCAPAPVTGEGDLP